MVGEQKANSQGVRLQSNESRNGLFKQAASQSSGNSSRSEAFKAVAEMQGKAGDAAGAKQSRSLAQQYAQATRSSRKGRELDRLGDCTRFRNG